MSHYKQDHLLAKSIVCAVVICLLLLNHWLLNVASVIIWFFGVNPVHYIIEHVRNHVHKSDLF